jgi:hypothetical protein
MKCKCHNGNAPDVVEDLCKFKEGVPEGSLFDVELDLLFLRDYIF